MYDDEFIELMSKASFGQSGYALSEYLQEPHKSFKEDCLVIWKRILTSLFFGKISLDTDKDPAGERHWTTDDKHGD